MISQPDGTVLVFDVASELHCGALYVGSAGSTSWNAVPGGGNSWCLPSAARNVDGRVEIFAVDGHTGATWHNWQLQPNSGPNNWSGWQPLGNQSLVFYTVPGEIFVTSNEDGRLEAFAVNHTDNALYHIWQTTPGGYWSDWSSMGGYWDDLTMSAALNFDGRLEIFKDGDDGILYHQWQTSANGEWNGNWEPLPGLTGMNIGAFRNAGGALEVVAWHTVHGDYTSEIWHSWQTSPGGGWSGWAKLADTPYPGASSWDVGQNQDGRLEVFTINGYAASQAGMFHMWQTAPAGGWTGWSAFPLPDGSKIIGWVYGVCKSDTGKLVVVVEMESGQLISNEQDEGGYLRPENWVVLNNP